MDFSFVGMFIAMIVGTLSNVIMLMCVLVPFLGLWLVYLRRKQPPEWTVAIGTICFVSVTLLGLVASPVIAVKRGLLEGDLYSMAVRGDTEAVERALRWGIDVDANYNDVGYTPLMGAARNGDNNTVKLLLRYHADVNREASCDTALQMAKEANHLDTVQILEAAGATR